MPTCNDCDGHVSDAYFRVFSVEGVLYACPGCRDKSSYTKAHHPAARTTLDRVSDRDALRFSDSYS